MNDLSYNFLRKLQQTERGSMALTVLSSEFYGGVCTFLTTQQDNLKEEQSLMKVKEIENTKKVLEDILRSRQRKILLRALQSTSKDTEGMAPEEVKLYREMRKVIGEHTLIIDNIIAGKKISSISKSIEDFKKVKILKNVPAYKGIDGTLYGPYAPHEEKELPVKEAEFLIKTEVAEVAIID